MINNFSVTSEQEKDGKLFLTVSTENAVLRGMKWTQLGAWGKRKFENMLFLTRVGKKYVKVVYR